MLSPHEFATLMLIQSAPDQIEMTRVELDILLESQLVAFERGESAGPHRRLMVTPRGAHVLEAAARLQPAAHGEPAPSSPSASAQEY